MNVCFDSAAVQWMKEHYGKGFIINYDRSNDYFIVFDQYDQTGRRYMRKYLPLPDWANTSITVEVIKDSGQEVPVNDEKPTWPII